MDPRMRPLFPGIRFAGIAHTMAYDLTDRPLEPMGYDGFAERQYAPGPEGLWREAGPWGAAGEVLVIDAKGTGAGNASRPGALVVADDDGVVVVPQDIAAEVIDRAAKIQEADRPSRRDGYTKLGIPFDETVI